MKSSIVVKVLAALVILLLGVTIQQFSRARALITERDDALARVADVPIAASSRQANDTTQESIDRAERSRLQREVDDLSGRGRSDGRLWCF